MADCASSACVAATAASPGISFVGIRGPVAAGPTTATGAIRTDSAAGAGVGTSFGRAHVAGNSRWARLAHGVNRGGPRRWAVVGVAMVALVAGTTAVALQVVASPSTPRQHAGHSAARHTASHKAKVTAAPVVIPPAPSTTTTTTVPSFSSIVAGGVRYDGGGPVPHYVGAVAPPTINGSPTNIVDPSVVATAAVPNVPMYAAPGAAAPTCTMPIRNNLGAVLTLLVTGYQPGWVQAYIPVRPNESTAWIPASDVSVSLVTTHIVVSLSARTLTLYRNNLPVFHTAVAPGEPSSPTPTGSFFVAYIVKLTDPGGPYGPYTLGTSAFSNTYFSFEGGPGQVGIHGTDQPWVIGSYASHGCVRLPNAAITTVAQQIVPGTPVEIER